MSSPHGITIESFIERWEQGEAAWTAAYLQRKLGEHRPDLVEMVRAWSLDRIRSGKRTPMCLEMNTADLVIKRVREGKIGPMRTTEAVDSRLTQLWEENHARLVRIAHSQRYGSSREDAEDAVSDAVVELRQALLRGDYDLETADLGALLAGYVRNTVRRRTPHTTSLEGDDWQERDSYPRQYADYSTTDPLDHVVAMEIRDEVHQVLGEMPQEGITAALLAWAGEWKIDRIAEALGATWQQCSNWKHEVKYRIEAGDTLAGWLTD